MLILFRLVKEDGGASADKELLIHVTKHANLTLVYLFITSIKLFPILVFRARF